MNLPTVTELAMASDADFDRAFDTMMKAYARRCFDIDIDDHDVHQLTMPVDNALEVLIDEKS